MTESELTALYQRYGYLVRRRCLQLLRSRADADDALQEVFVRVLKYHREQGGTSMLGWLQGIAANVCFDLLKKRGRDEPRDPLAEPSPGGQVVGTPQDSERRAVIGWALRSLDSRTREIGLRHHLDGLTQEEVAEHTGLSRKTVGKKLALFEAELRRLLGIDGRPA